MQQRRRCYRWSSGGVSRQMKKFKEGTVMCLLSKKPPCPICGGKISWFLPPRIEGKYICNACYEKMDMETDRKTNLTMQEFREYLVFYDQNQILKNKLVVSEIIDFTLWDTKIIFDYENKLFCLSENPVKTVFEGKQLKSFTIKEDSALLFEGSAEGIKRYTSAVPEQAMALTAQIIRFMMNQQHTISIDDLSSDKDNNCTTLQQYFDVPGPFKAFNIVLNIDHPYWNVIKCDMRGPSLSNENPDVEDYMNSYKQSIEEIMRLVNALKRVAFPNAVEQFIG